MSQDTTSIDARDTDRLLSVAQEGLEQAIGGLLNAFYRLPRDTYRERRRGLCSEWNEQLEHVHGRIATLRTILDEDYHVTVPDDREDAA